MKIYFKIPLVQNLKWIRSIIVMFQYRQNEWSFCRVSFIGSRCDIHSMLNLKRNLREYQALEGRCSLTARNDILLIYTMRKTPSLSWFCSSLEMWIATEIFSLRVQQCIPEKKHIYITHLGLFPSYLSRM